MFKRKSKSNDDDDKTIDEENPGRTRFEIEEQKLWTSPAASSLKKELLSINLVEKSKHD